VPTKVGLDAEKGQISLDSPKPVHEMRLSREVVEGHPVPATASRSRASYRPQDSNPGGSGLHPLRGASNACYGELFPVEANV
jgi:hypothetical protein